MARVICGDRVREVGSRRLGTVLHADARAALVAWDEPSPQAKTGTAFVPLARLDILPSYLRGIDGRLRRGYAYHVWRASYGVPLDYVAALIEEAAVLIDEHYGGG